MAIHIPIWLIIVTCVATASAIITTINNDTGYKPKKYKTKKVKIN